MGKGRCGDGGKGGVVMGEGRCGDGGKGGVGMGEGWGGDGGKGGVAPGFPAAKRGPILKVALTSHDLPAAKSCDDAFLTEAVQALCSETDRKEKVSPKEVSTTYFEIKSHKTLLPNGIKSNVSFQY